MKCKFVSVLILLSVVNVLCVSEYLKKKDHWYSGCDYLDSPTTDSIQIYCTSRPSDDPIINWDEGCPFDIFDLSNENRFKVHFLKTDQCRLPTSYYYYKLASGWISFYFPNLRSLDISFSGIEELKDEAKDFWQTYHCFDFKNLEKLNASHNEISKFKIDFFKNTPNLTEIDLSSNLFTALHRADFLGASKLSAMNFSNNLIRNLYDQTFGDLVELKVLDLSHNRIQIISENVFANNKKLTDVRLQNNPIQLVSCSYLLRLKIPSLEFRYNAIERFDINCLGDSMSFDVKNDDEVILHPFGNETELIFTKIELKNLRYFNASGNHLQNILDIFPILDESIETMDLASNFIGKLNASTFSKFTNLQHLNLSRTNLSNFEFGTFYNQRKLKVLDISYNQLRKVNFNLFLRNFQVLTTLNLEGNDLIEIDTVTHSHFPVLKLLGISRNLFCCDYLTKFLLDWKNLSLMYNPSNGNHVDGVNCHLHSKNTSRPGCMLEGVVWFLVPLLLLLHILLK